MDTPLFRSEEDVGREADSFRKWPPPERLMLKCQVVNDLQADGLEATARDMRRRLRRVVTRAQRWGLISDPQAVALRLTLDVGSPSDQSAG